MSLPVTSKALIRPAPIKGMNYRDPLAAMDPLSAEWIQNYICEDQSVKNRPGTKVHNTIVDSGPSALQPFIMALGSFGVGVNEKLFAYVQNSNSTTNVHRVWDVSVLNTATSVYAASDQAAGSAVWFEYRSYGTFLVDQLANSSFPTTNDGTTWTNGWVEYTAGSKILAAPSAYYKSRVYTLYNNEIYFGNSGIPPQITGVLASKFNIQDLYKFDPATSWMATFSLTDANSNEQYIAFGNKAGEVLVYQGDYPFSTTWRLTGQYVIDAPVGYKQSAVIQFQSDALIITQKALISLKDLVTKGNQIALEQSLSEPINRYWTELFSNISDPFASVQGRIGGIWAQKQRQILILVPGFLDSNGTFSDSYSTILCVNTGTGAWSTWRLPQASTSDNDKPGNLTYFKNEVYYSASASVYKFDPTLFVDQIKTGSGTLTYSIPLQCYGPHTSIDQTSVIKVSGFSPSLKDDLPRLGISVRVDFGVQNNGPTYPARKAGYNKRLFSVGAEGTFFQYRMTGETVYNSTTSTTGIEFFSINLEVEKGGVR